MAEESAELTRKAAYIDTIRRLHRRTRNAGFVACLVGALILIGARYIHGMPAWGVYVGAAVILLGWALFAVAIFRRTAWVRAHPFDPDG